MTRGGGIRAAALLAATLIAAGCRSPGVAPSPRASAAVEEVEGWRSAASSEDAAKLEAIPARWTLALAEAKRRGAARQVTAAGALLDPNLALVRGAPAPGSYRCRLIRLNRNARNAYAVSGWAFCFIGVEGEQLSLAAETPARRIGGYLWEPKDGRRLVFLGGTVPARATTAVAYGDAPVTDAVGVLTRIGDFRYRLVLPGPAAGNSLDVIELVAAPRPS